MGDLVVACPLVPGLSRLVSRACSSPRAFVSRFLQTPPHGDALALPLSFASTSLDRGLSPPSSMTCTAHTLRSGTRPQPRLFGFSSIRHRDRGPLVRVVRVGGASGLLLTSWNFRLSSSASATLLAFVPRGCGGVLQRGFVFLLYAAVHLFPVVSFRVQS